MKKNNDNIEYLKCGDAIALSITSFYLQKPAMPSMANSSCYPLRKLRITRLREKASVVSIGIGIRIRVPILIGIIVLSISLLLLSEENQYQQGGSQSNNEQTLEQTLVNVKIQVVIVTIFMAFRLQAAIFIIVSLAFIKVLIITLLVIVDESCDPLSESSTRFQIWIYESISD